MTRVQVDTESGARYIIDTELKLMRRERPTEINLPEGVGLSLMKNDGQDVPFLDIAWPIEVGGMLGIVWNDNGRAQIRTSTFITAVKEIDVPSAPDQPA